MSREIVEVKEIAEQGVLVEGIQASACSSCNAKAGCGHASLAKIGRPVRLWVPTEKSLQVGQHVVLDLPDGSLAASATTMYGIPLLGLVIGAASGQSAGDLGAFVSGAAGLLIGFLIARGIANRFRDQWQPRVVEVCESPQIQLNTLSH
ncbi:MAG: SoxR reducing system RseC family protein [Oceanobacter sp.]